MTACAHNHSEAGRRQADRRAAASGAGRLTAAFVVISVFMVVEAVGGFIAGSLALLADAAHMLTDSMALGLAVGAQYIAQRPADERRHFGYQRARVLAAFVNGILLLILLVWIAYEAFERFSNPVDINARVMLWIAFLGLGANAVAFFILHRAHSEDLNIRGAMLHVISDLIGSVAAIIAAFVIILTGWPGIDPLLSLVVVALIGQAAIRLIKETGHILLQGAPKGIDVRALADEVIAAAPGVEDVHEVKIWQLTPDQISLTMHARVKDSNHACEALDKIKQLLDRRYGITLSTIQIETGAACPDFEEGGPGDDARELGAAGGASEPHAHHHQCCASSGTPAFAARD